MRGPLPEEQVRYPRRSPAPVFPICNVERIAPKIIPDDAHQVAGFMRDFGADEGIRALGPKRGKQILAMFPQGIAPARRLAPEFGSQSVET
jgi:hypothetical protein